MSVAFDFSGRTVLITGGGRGIGRSLVRFFADAGATTAVIYVDERALDQLAAPRIANCPRGQH